MEVISQSGIVFVGIIMPSEGRIRLETRAGKCTPSAFNIPTFLARPFLKSTIYIADKSLHVMA